MVSGGLPRQLAFHANSISAGYDTSVISGVLSYVGDDLGPLQLSGQQQVRLVIPLIRLA